MFLRNYLIRFSFLLVIVQLALAVYLVSVGIGDGEFYDKMFFYSMFLSLVPFIFGIIIFSFSNQTNSYLEKSNGFVNKNSLTDKKDNQINETSLYLFALGIGFFTYSFVFKLLALPNWLILILPIVLSLLILKNSQKINLLASD